MRFDVITIFPGFFGGPLDVGVLRRAREAAIVDVHLHDLRGFAHDRHRTVDDRPFGGGEGMVLRIEPIAEALASINVQPKADRSQAAESVVLLSPQGRPFTQAVAHELATTERVVLLCGRYEGVDERVNQAFCDRELSIGDYVLSGGELAAAVIIDTVTRLLPGVLGNPDSSRYESFGAAETQGNQPAGAPPRSTHGAGGLLDYPHYTRPAEFLGLTIPEALRGGNHEEVRRWRRRAALEKTLRNRPDLLSGAELTKEDRHLLDELRLGLEGWQQ